MPTELNIVKKGEIFEVRARPLTYARELRPGMSVTIK